MSGRNVERGAVIDGDPHHMRFYKVEAKLKTHPASTNRRAVLITDCLARRTCWLHQINRALSAESLTFTVDREATIYQK